ERAVSETSDEFFVTLYADIEEAIDEFFRYTQVLDELCGSESPPSSSIREALTSCRDIVHGVAKDILEREALKQELTAECTEDESGDEQVGGSASVASGAFAVGDIRNREDALKSLSQIAEFYRKDGPLTPITYLLQQSVRWGR